MKIRDLLKVLNTDSVVLARENDILVDCETPYINPVSYTHLNHGGKILICGNG